ncbi:creatine kinase M-type-like protein [Lates japonicus]|uniref:creatine kinase n=1 Tax=Lates japonicus TaxID=270547 RepID=A0AAD3M6F8_LATJO|nr:creatine kinase M-type-like protein [Lates japonicus]
MGFPPSALLQALLANQGTVEERREVLTTDLWCLRSKSTPGRLQFLDDVIQTGVDNPGHPFIMTVGCVAGDEESYEVFKDLLDPVISDRHGGYKPTDKHKTDLNFENLYGGDDLDPNHAPSSRSVSAAASGFTLPLANSRGERGTIGEPWNSLEGEFMGVLPLNGMTDAEQEQLESPLITLCLTSPCPPADLGAGMARDWPDGRGIYSEQHRHIEQK